MQQVCRILVVLLLLAFGLGTPGYAMPSGDMSHGMTMSDEGHGAPDDCGSCADRLAMSACVFACLAIQAILPDAGMTIGCRTGTFDRPPQQRISGSTAAPDPFPPKLPA